MSELTIRAPLPEDGIKVHRLVKQCPPLDVNSVYCNLLQCDHFSATSVAAEQDGELRGFISGYKIPDQKSNGQTLFIWQVAVSSEARGMGLASKMLNHILNRDACDDVSYIETTITESNRASWALFESLSKKLNAELNHSVKYDREKHFDGEHDSEMLVRIGPFEIKN